MHHFKYLFLFTALFLLNSLQAQKAPEAFAETRIDTSGICPGESKALAVIVKNLVGIDELNLVLKFDPTVVSFRYEMNRNPDLVGGVFNVTENPEGTVQINWSGGFETSLLADTLVFLVFEGKSGQSDLTWDTLSAGNCYYHTTSGTFLSTSFISGFIQVHPKMFLTLTEINQTCSGKCDANFEADLSGGTFPFEYLWNDSPGRFDSIQTNLCDGPNSIRVTDALGCDLDSIYLITGLPGPKVEIKAKCKNEDLEEIIIYRENPTLEFSFDEISPTHVVEPPLWDFGDGDTTRSFNPVHTYYRAQDNKDNFYNLKLTLKNDNGCDTTIVLKIEIKDKKLKICNVILPSSASTDNQKFTIFDESGNLMKTEYVRFEVYIFDRWGRRLYANEDYENDWSPVNLPNGVYYYVVKSVGYFNTDKYKGSFTILGGE